MIGGLIVTKEKLVPGNTCLFVHAAETSPAGDFEIRCALE